jgi:hypothetical protein
MPTPLTADDRLAIIDVLARYARCIDFHRWDEFPALFTEDCVVDFGKVMGVHAGRDGVAAMAKMIGGTGLIMRHYTTNVIIDGDGERVEVTSWRTRGRPSAACPRRRAATRTSS